MFNKTASGSKKKIRMNETPTKSHTASIHLKTHEDQYNDVYRLPLKEMVLQRRDDDYSQASQKKIRQQLKLEGLAVMSSRFHKKSDSRSAKKISINEQYMRAPLGTDRSTKQLSCSNLASKRMRTETDNPNEEPSSVHPQSYRRLIQQYSEENKKLKQDIKKKKDHIEIRVEDLTSFISQYSKLKMHNVELQQELAFYKSSIAIEQACHNSVFKVLDQ